MSDRTGRPGGKRPAPYRGFAASAGAVMSAGFTVVTSTVAGYLLGAALDRGKPRAFFTPICLLLGLLAGLHRIYRVFRFIAKGKGD